jgi:hypothetical protein
MEAEAGASAGRRVYGLASAFAFVPLGVTLDSGILEVDSGRVEVGRDKVLGHTWEAVSEWRALATVESVQIVMEEPGTVVV